MVGPGSWVVAAHFEQVHDHRVYSVPNNKLVTMFVNWTLPFNDVGYRHNFQINQIIEKSK